MCVCSPVYASLRIEPGPQITSISHTRIPPFVSDPPLSLSRPQVESIKKTSEFVSQLRRVGKGHGTYQWDQDLMATLPA